MAYTKQNFTNGVVLDATQLNNMDNQVAANEAAIDEIKSNSYATEEYVKNKIAEAELGGEEVDLSGYAQKSELPTKTSDLTNDSGFITEYTETDPTVPAWAKQPTKPTYTASEVGALPNTTTIPTVPTKVSAFTNDAGYLTEHQSLVDYAKTADLGDLAAKDSLTASDVGADASGTASSLVSEHNSDETAHADIREAISQLSGENQNYVLPVGGDELGGVKNGGNVTINADGTMTAPDNAPTDEQVGDAVNAYLDANGVAAGATPEEKAQIEANTRSADVLNTVLQNSVLYEWPGLADDRVPKYEGYTLAVSTSTGNLARRAVTGHRYLNGNSIILRQGDRLVTNADCAADAPAQYTPVLLKKVDAFDALYNTGTPVAYGRAAFDGQYITYTATDPVEYIHLSYNAEVDYAVKVYVAAARADEVTIPVTYAPGYLKATTGAPTSVGDGTSLYPTGYCTELMTDLITVSAPGKFLLVKNVTLNDSSGGFRSGFVWARYAEDGETMTYGHIKTEWDLTKNYYVIPLIADVEYIRFAFTAAANPLERLECMVVDINYLVRSGCGLHTYGKSVTAFGDSYIGEWSGSVSGAKILAWRNLMPYTPFGHNGWGIAASPNYPNGLIDLVAEELGSTDTDVYVIQAGRNDYNCQVPIGTNEDLHGPDIVYTKRSFKGALNWLCQWLVQNKPAKKVVFFTPWFFPSRSTSTDAEGNGTGSEFVETYKPEEYIDAIIEIAGRWGIPVLDCARNAGMHVRDEAFRTAYYRSADDVSHLNATGAALFARNVQPIWEIIVGRD